MFHATNTINTGSLQSFTHISCYNLRVFQCKTVFNMLSKSMGIMTLLSSTVAGIIGSGWLLGPLVCARIAGPAAVITWMLAGLLMIVIASTFVILIRVIPIAGGTVRFFQITYGHFAGFSFSWIIWLGWVAVSPIETMALIQYSSNYIPGLMTVGVSPVLTATGTLVAMGGVALITLINSYGVHIYGKVNYVILAFKLIVPIAIVVLLLHGHFHAHNFTVVDGFMPYGIHGVLSALPLAGVLYSFMGFNPAIQCASESINPRRDVPIAIFGSLAICIILYTLIQVAFIGALPSSSLKNGWAAVRFLDDNGPFVGLLSAFGFVWFVKILYLDAMISPFGTAMVQAMATGRMTYAMGKNRYLPQRFMKVNKHSAPKSAMVLNMIIGFVFFLPFPSWQHMVGFLVTCLILGYVMGPMSLIIMIKVRPEQFNFLPVKFIQGLCLLAFYICNLMIFWSGWHTIAKVMILFVLGYVILAGKMLFDKGENRIKSLNIMAGSWVIVYMVGMAVISYLSSFGGGTHTIPFGVDAGVVAIFSVVIYLLASYLGTREDHTADNSELFENTTV